MHVNHEAERWLRGQAVPSFWGASVYVAWSKQIKPLHFVITKYRKGHVGSLCSSSQQMVGERACPSDC